MRGLKEYIKFQPCVFPLFFRGGGREWLGGPQAKDVKVVRCFAQIHL